MTAAARWRGILAGMEQIVPSRRRYTVDEYFALDEDADERHEFRDGEVLNMPGGTYEHEVIVANLIRHLGNRLDGSPCRVRGSNLRVRADRTRYSYPDLSIVCGPPAFDPPRPTSATLANPRVLIEVLSPSTAADDRGEKFTRYRRIASLQEYLLVWQDRPQVEPFYRQPDGVWGIGQTVEGLDAVLTLASVGVELPLAEVYADVAFPPPSPDGSDGI